MDGSKTVASRGLHDLANCPRIGRLSPVLSKRFFETQRTTRFPIHFDFVFRTGFLFHASMMRRREVRFNPSKALDYSTSVRLRKYRALGYNPRMRLTLVLPFLCAFPLFAQTGFTMKQLGCPNTGTVNPTAIQAFTLITLPTPIGVVPVPMCLILGSGFTVDRTTWTLNVTPVVAPMPSTAQLPLIQSFSLDPATPATTLTVTFTLAKIPVQGTPILAFFNSSQDASGAATAAVAAGGTQPAQILVTLPTYRPFTADDRITIVYWGQQLP